MNEKEYILATNLAKLKIIDSIVRSLFTDVGYGITKDTQIDILNNVDEAIENLEKQLDE